MDGEKKPVFWMILFGIVRHGLSVVGAWLASRGLIDADTHERLLSEGATQIVGWILVAIPVAWSVLQKLQVWEWVKTALHLNNHLTVAAEIPEMSPGPNLPL